MRSNICRLRLLKNFIGVCVCVSARALVQGAFVEIKGDLPVLVVSYHLCYGNQSVLEGSLSCYGDQSSLLAEPFQRPPMLPNRISSVVEMF